MATGDEVMQVIAWHRRRVESLTPREREVAQHVACGLRNHEVAQAMTLDVTTVCTYMWHIFNKLGVKSRSQLTAVALLTGLVDAAMVVSLWAQYAPEVMGCD